MKNRKRPPDGSPVRGRTAIRLRQIYRIYPNRTYPTDKASRIPARTAERRPVPCGRADRMSTQRFGRGAVSAPPPHRRSSGQGPTAPSGRGRRTFPFPYIRAGRLPYTAKSPSPPAQSPLSEGRLPDTPDNFPPRNLFSGSRSSGSRKREHPGSPNLRSPDCFPQYVIRTVGRTKSTKLRFLRSL